MKDTEYAALGLQAPLSRVSPPTGPSDLAHLTDRAATIAPDAEALDDGRRSYTFRELADAVSAGAALFNDAGVRAGDRIAASLGNEASIIIAFFSAMKLGAVWVGINKILPADDKRYILEHSGAKFLLTDGSLQEQINNLRPSLPALEHVWFLDQPNADGGWQNAMKSGPRPFERRDIDPFAPATIMYTSGTTGVPKGVAHSQHNMVTVPSAQFAHGLMQPNARRGSWLPLTITNVMILGPVSAVFSVKPFYLAPSPKIEPLIDWLHAKDIESIPFVPAMVYDLLQTDRDLPSGLRLGCGGAPLPDVIRTAFYKRYGYAIMTSYGLTEAPTVVAQTSDVDAPDGVSGKVLPHLEVAILDPDGRVMPEGEVGEICFRAAATGPWANVYTPPLGYWRDAAKTAALLKDGYVHTGDHGSVDAQGWLRIADRSSELILRGGSNVYPAEIERVLHQHPDVADCAIVGKPDLRMGMLTAAFVQPASPHTDLTKLQADLIALCAKALVKYKMPDEWHFSNALPRNAMGKVIKPKLRDLLKDGAASR